MTGVPSGETGPHRDHPSRPIAAPARSIARIAASLPEAASILAIARMRRVTRSSDPERSRAHHDLHGDAFSFGIVSRRAARPQAPAGPDDRFHQSEIAQSNDAGYPGSGG